MKFLIDANLPPVFAQWLSSQGDDAFHVSELNLESATDRDIWRRARLECVYRDQGRRFCLLHAIDQAGPAVDWIRIGNAARRVLLQRLPTVWPEIVSALERGEKIIEVR